MRWEQLFNDLESRFDQEADAQLLAESADRQRVAAGALLFTSRLVGAVGRPVRLRLTTGAPATGALRSVGPDWVLLAERPGREALVNLAAVTAVEGVVHATGAPLQGIALRLDLRHMLRGIVRDRSPVSLLIPGSASGTERTGSEITGTLDRVGADFVEMAVHAAWEPRRAASVRSVLAFPLRAVVTVRAMPLG